MELSLIPSLAAALILVTTAGAQSVQGMNYQGRLTDAAGDPVAGPQATLTFSLWDASTAGNMVWGEFEVTADLIDGRFNVVLGPDDGQTPPRDIGGSFTGPRFLQIRVGTGDPLPRQEILPAPAAYHADHADHATTADTAANFTSTVLFTDETNQRVGIGTPNPGAKLELMVDGAGLRQSTTDLLSQLGTTVWPGRAEIGTLTPSDLWLTTNNVNRLTILSDGKTGIGTESPTAELEVRGDIKLGPSGQYHAAAATEENLRIVRGVVNIVGTDVTKVIGGDQYSVDNEAGDGRWKITFVPSFSAAPVVTANSYYPVGHSETPADNYIVVRELTPGYCLLISLDDVASGGPNAQDDAGFTFIAIGPR